MIHWPILWNSRVEAADTTSPTAQADIASQWATRKLNIQEINLLMGY